MKPLVSILIPAFNAQPWIADTIKSALAQTWPAKEIIIVVADASTDQTLLIARRFTSKTVSVVIRPHRGAAAARNEAFSMCQGDYIQWLDADDLLAPEKIARQMQAVKQCHSKHTLFSSAWGHFMYRTSKAKFSPTPLWCDLSPEEWLLRKMGQNLHMQPATWLISRELAEAAGPWDTRVSVDEDGEYFCRLVLASDGIRFIPDAKVFYRVSGSGSYTYRAISDRDGRLHSIQLQAGHLLSLSDCERARSACLSYLQTSLIHFYPERMDIVKQLEQLAVTLGGRLQMPRLRWKYALIGRIFGYGLGKRAQVLLPHLKSSLLRFWDRTMSQMESRAGTRIHAA